MLVALLRALGDGHILRIFANDGFEGADKLSGKTILQCIPTEALILQSSIISKGLNPIRGITT